MTRGNGQSVHELALYLLAIGVIVGLLGWLLRPYILEYGWLATQYNLDFLHWLLNSGKATSYLAHIFMPGVDEVLLQQHQFTLEQPSSDWERVRFYLSIVGQSLRPILCLMILLLVRRIWVRHQPSRLRRQFGIDQLAVEASKYNSALRPVLAANLLEQNPDKGPLRRDESPIRTAIMEGLIRVYPRQFDGSIEMTTTLIPTFEEEKKAQAGYEFVMDDLDKGISQLHGRCVIQPPAVEAYFIKQLSNKVTSIDDLNVVERAFLAICLPMMHADKATTFNLIKRLNLAFDPRLARKNDPSWIPEKHVNQIIDQYQTEHSLLNELFEQHGFVLTLLTEALTKARTKGKLPTDTLMYWIKWHHRPLWYSINMVGTPTAWMSTAAVRSAYLMEKRLGRKLDEPFIASAVAAFETFMSETEGWLYAND